MAKIATPRGLMYPLIFPPETYAQTETALLNGSETLDATGEIVAMMGYAYIEGRAASKTVSAAGGASISFRTGTCTWANGSTTMRVGIQDVDDTAGAGPLARPDGTFDVYRDVVGGDANITTAAFQTLALSTSGTKTISHGQKIAVVFDMTARAGSDSVILSAGNPSANNLPVNNRYIASAWATGSGTKPNVIITSDDGTLIGIDMCTCMTSAVAEQFADSTNPDERGLIFQVPWDVDVDALWMYSLNFADTSDGTIALLNSPTSSPTELASASSLAEQGSPAFLMGLRVFPLASVVSLTKNTNYIVAFRATGAGNVQLVTGTLGNTAYRKLLPGAETLAKATRNNASPGDNFTAESPAITLYRMGVRISAIEEGSGGGGPLIAGRLAI